MKHLIKTILTMIGIIGWILPIGGIIVYVIGYPLPYYHHNALMRRFERSLARLPLPSETSIRQTSSYFGIMYGNGNKCDAIVGALLESKQRYDKLYTFLNTMNGRLQAPWTSPYHEKISLFQITGQEYYAICEQGRKLITPKHFEDRFGETYWQYDELQYFENMLEISHISTQQPYYLVIARDLGQQTFYHLLDFRCN